MVQQSFGTDSVSWIYIFFELKTVCSQEPYVKFARTGTEATQNRCR